MPGTESEDDEGAKSRSGQASSDFFKGPEPSYERRPITDDVVTGESPSEGTGPASRSDARGSRTGSAGSVVGQGARSEIYASTVDGNSASEGSNSTVGRGSAGGGFASTVGRGSAGGGLDSTVSRGSSGAGFASPVGGDSASGGFASPVGGDSASGELASPVGCDSASGGFASTVGGDSASESSGSTFGHDSRSGIGASEGDHAERMDGTESTESAWQAPIRSFKLPTYVPEVIRHYVETSVALILSPSSFFKGLTNNGDFSKPALFLAISSCGSALLTFLLGGFQLGHVISNAMFVAIANAVLAAVAFVLSKGMGSKASFITVFQVFAFCSCFGLLATLPGVGMLFSAAGLVYCFFGLREVLGVTMYQTCTIMVLMFMIQALISVAHSLGH